MGQIFDKLYSWIEKFGRRNFILVLFILFVLIVSGFYATFSLFTFSEGVSIVDGVKTLKFVLGDSSFENSITIASESSKNIAITVSNKDKIALKYGIYYTSSDDLEEVEIGYYHSTEYLPIGIIQPGEDYVITLQIENHSSDAKIITFGTVYGFPNGGDLVLEENQYFLNQKWNFPLSEVQKGSYVEYVGSNGCIEGQCDGKLINPNQVDSYGFCGNEEYTYQTDGWRVAYVRKGITYLVSAGAVECIQEISDEVTMLLDEINERAIRYCNLDYAYGMVCNEKSAWSITINHIYYIINSKLDMESCLEKENNSSCGYQNDLVDIGGIYWLSNIVQNNLLYYSSHPMYYTFKKTDIAKGVRPILKLSDSIIVVRGSGTKDDPYQIRNTVMPDYEYTVIYHGNGASDGDTEDSIHQSNVVKKLNKNGFNLSYQIRLSDIASFDDSYCDADGNCYESSVEEVQNKTAKFLGWSFNEQGDEAMYLDEEEVVNLSSSSSESIVNLYAIWEYDSFRLPDIQERDGYEVLGWYTNRDSGEKVGDPGDEYTNLDKVTLYARWKEKI